MSNSERKITLVEEALRSQREAWREIADRVSQISDRDLPHELPKRILLFGVGSSHFAARLVAFSLIRSKYRVRIPVRACTSTWIGHEIVPTKGDWALGFTHRGTSSATVQALELCERSGAFTIQVSSQGAKESPSARYVLPTVPLEKVEPHTISVTGAICAASSLLMGTKAHEEWEALRCLGDPNLENLRNKVGEGPSILLGEWEGEWLAREGALKLMEMANLPVRAFGSEEYFHGAHWSEKSEDKIWHIGHAKDPRNDEIKAALSIDIFGSSPLAWVPVLVELQWMALAVALNRGLNPDDPRN